MTRREYIAEQLLNPDGEYDEDSDYTNTVNFFIKCPHCDGDPEAMCGDSEIVNLEICIKCKDAWLDREVDA